jgi:glyoxylase-like metal-dependent hydrolase (beta-lactamase superfamily II)
VEIRRLFQGSVDGFLGPATPFNGYAIVHPQGVVLVDTAFGQFFGEGRSGRFGPDDSYGWVARSTLASLDDHGLEAGDVKFVINTHLGDHSGENYLFPEATFFLRRPETEWIRARDDEHAARGRSFWDFDGARIEYLDEDDVEVLPGITSVFTPGHTPGHQSVLVEGGGTKELLVGDAIYLADIYDDLSTMTEEHVAWRQQGAGEHWFESAGKLRGLDADAVHFAHDPTIRHRVRGSTRR